MARDAPPVPLGKGRDDPCDRRGCADLPDGDWVCAFRRALACRRFLLIETDTAHLREWGEALLARHVPFIGLRPPEGAHPIAPPRSTMQ